MQNEQIDKTLSVLLQEDEQFSNETLRYKFGKNHLISKVKVKSISLAPPVVNTQKINFLARFVYIDLDGYMNSTWFNNL